VCTGLCVFRPLMPTNADILRSRPWM